MLKVVLTGLGDGAVAVLTLLQYMVPAFWEVSFSVVAEVIAAGRFEESPNPL